MEEVEDVVIVGAGIAGLATAVALKRYGVRALVLERSEGLRAMGAGLTLFPNAWLALEALGVDHKLSPLYSPSTKGFLTNIQSGATQEVSMAGSDSGGGPRTVHRKALLEALAEELPFDTIRFSSKLKSIEEQELEGSSVAVLHMEDCAIIKTKILIGCDGVYSVVARWLGLTKPVNSGRWAVRGLAVFPQGHGYTQNVWQYLDVGTRAGFVPLTDKELYWFLTTNNPLPKGEDMTAGNPEQLQREVIENIAQHFPSNYIDVVRHADLSTLTISPLMLRLPWDVIFGNAHKGTFTVAGDAMHPMTPDLGQGGGSSLEDAVVLGRHIGESVVANGRLVPREAANAIGKYVKERRWRAAWLISGSYLAGWAQQDGSGWWRKFFRDMVYYRLIFPRLLNAVKYDCGSLTETRIAAGSKKIE
ncbi:hypothetical protein RJ640_009999 [Escallonia rubra]|uniref:FAD-binding domain-containing protein n=1 Tax=Escallonia rubra TaxID=112253 RepID=A0AA88US51_9ASTE|nr:hypothetical protein RJ640_009999 [Escallonia rubra]